MGDPTQIQVEKEVLAAQIQKLQDLIASDELTAALAGLDGAFVESSGGSADSLNGFKGALDSLQAAMGQLFQQTLDFLQNTHGNFVAADEQGG